MPDLGKSCPKRRIDFNLRTIHCKFTYIHSNIFLNFQFVTACRRVEDYLNGLLEKMAADMELESMDRLTEDFHVYPDFHGNRSPVADPTLKGMV